MDTEIDLAISTVGGVAVFFGHLWAIYKVITGVSDKRRNRIKEEYDFSEKYLNLLKDETKSDYLVETGFNYLTGFKAPANVIKFLFLQYNPTVLIRNYILAYKYLTPSCSNNGLVVTDIQDKKYFKMTHSRWKFFHLGMYVLFAIFGSIPFYPSLYGKIIINLNFSRFSGSDLVIIIHI